MEARDAARFYVGEAAHAYELFARQRNRGGLRLAEAARPKTGSTAAIPARAELLENPKVSTALAATLTPTDVSPAGYDAVLYVSGSGTMWCSPDTEPLADIARRLQGAPGLTETDRRGE